MSVRERLSEPGPKRLLALDGGGIRGLITLGYLTRIEEILRRRHGDPGLVLSDYFDLVGGTSTGAIIATALALGWPVAEIQRMYSTLGHEAFRPRRSWLGPVSRLIGPKFDDRPLAEMLRRHLGDRTLESPDLRVGLMVVAKRADTASVWVLVNIPGHKFFGMNKALPLWEVVRASTAAPTYFEPQWLSDVGGGESGVFVDGGVSMHNNPALQLLMVATLEGFALRWPLGEENLLLCSVGTGDFSATASQQAIRRFSNLHWLGLLTVQLMRDASELNQTILQWMSQSPTARSLDRQIGSLVGDQLGPTPLISYLRYNVRLEQSALGELGLRYGVEEVARLQDLSDVGNIAELVRIGAAAGAAQVREEHFPVQLDRGYKTVPSHPPGSAPPTDARTALPHRLVIGVTGPRHLTDSEGLARQVRSVLDRIRAELSARSTEPRRFVVLSPLAEGADRLVAREVLRRPGAQLEVVLPLAHDDYLRDFERPESKAEFGELYGRASRIVPVGPVSTRAEAYERAGRYVVDHCDILIALWDGKPASGRGGTAEIVHYARERGRPLFWIRTEGDREVLAEPGGWPGDHG